MILVRCISRSQRLKIDFRDENCSNYVPLAKNGPALWVTCFTLANIVKDIEKSSGLKPEGLEP